MEEKKERDSPPTRVKGEGTVCKRLALGGVCVCVCKGWYVLLSYRRASAVQIRSLQKV